MRGFKRSSVILLSAAMLVGSQAAFAGTLAFTASSGNITAFEGDVDARSIGGLALPKGSVSLSGTSINVNAVPEWLFDKHTVLTGVVINPTLSTQGPTSLVKGTAYFSKGEWLTNLGKNQASEIVTLNDGALLSGHVAGTTNAALDMVLADGSRRSVKFSEIASITSPRAYTFTIPAKSVKIDPNDGSYTAEVTDASFGTAMFHGGLALMNRKPKVPLSTLPGTEGGVSNKYIATMIATDILVNNVAPMVAIPIVFTRSTLKDRQLLFINQNNSVAQPPFQPIIFRNGYVYTYPTH